MKIERYMSCVYMSHSTGGQWLPVQQAAPEEGMAVGRTDLLTSLKQAKLKGQIVLKGMGVTDPLEQEFGEVVKPLMDSCTKEAIAVRAALCSVMCECLCHPQSGKGWIFGHSKTNDDCTKVVQFIVRK